MIKGLYSLSSEIISRLVNKDDSHFNSCGKLIEMNVPNRHLDGKFGIILDYKKLRKRTLYHIMISSDSGAKTLWADDEDFEYLF